MFKQGATNDDLNEILKDFPKFELSYETMMHNKVHDSDIICAIPEGPKMFAWFTVYQNENVCVLFDHKNENKKLQLIITSFHDTLVYGEGTILYGTLFNYNEVSCFCIEDIYYYKGRPLTEPNCNYLKKL